MGYRLYAGDVPDMPQYEGLTGLCFGVKKGHITHDITNKHPFEDNSVDSYQAEDVFEHIEFSKIAGIIDDIHRILKPGGLFRLSVPDYENPFMIARCDIVDGIIVKDREVPDHKWFPTNLIIEMLLDQTKFNLVMIYEDGDKIDYSRGYIQRTVDNDPRCDRSLSIVVDCYK